MKTCSKSFINLLSDYFSDTGEKTWKIWCSETSKFFKLGTEPQYNLEHLKKLNYLRWFSVYY